MKFLVLQVMFLYLLPVLTCIESIRNVESNQKNVHRTHMFSKLHKTAYVKLSAKEKMLQQKSIHSISNTNKQESTVYINKNNIFKWKEESDKQNSLNNLRKRHFTFVNIPYRRTFHQNDGERSNKLMSRNQDKNWNINDDHHHVIKRDADPDADTLNDVPPVHPSLAGASSGHPVLPNNPPPDVLAVSPSGLPVNPRPDALHPDAGEDADDDPPLPTPSDASQTSIARPDPAANPDHPPNALPPPLDPPKFNKSHTDSGANPPPLETPKNEIPTKKISNENLDHSTTKTPTKPATQSNGAAKSKTTQSPPRQPTRGTTENQHHTTMERTLPTPTVNGVKPYVEELQERTSETECKDGTCSALNVPGSRFSDGTWAMGSMTFILLLLTVSVLYTGLWKKRNQFIYGFKSREDGAASQRFQKTTVSDVLRRFNLTKKKEMIRLKRMFGSRYNKVPLTEGSDIEEEDSV